MQIVDGSDGAQLEFTGREIDHVVAFAQAAKTMFPAWLRRDVVIEGFERAPDLSHEVKREYRCLIQRAHVWGYIRTLEVRLSDSGGTKTIGGRNAVFEDLALDKISFATSLKEAELRDQLCPIIEAGETEEVGDWSRCILQAELQDDSDRLSRLLIDIISDIKDRGTFSDFRLVASRLNSLPAFASPQSSLRIIREVLELAESKHDSILHMYVCEAIYYWVGFLEGHSALRRRALEFLKRCRESSDAHVKLAALIATAEISEEQSNLSESLLRLLFETWSGRSAFLIYVRRTCAELLNRHGGRLKAGTSRIVKTLLPYIERNEHSGLLSLADTIDQLKREKKDPAAGDKFEELLFILCFLSGAFERLEMQENPLDGVRKWRIDIVGDLKEDLGVYPKGFPLVFEAKAKSSATVDDVRQLFSNCAMAQRMYHHKAGILAVYGEITSDARETLSKLELITDSKYLWFSRADIQRFINDPEELQRRIKAKLKREGAA